MTDTIPTVYCHARKYILVLDFKLVEMDVRHPWILIRKCNGDETIPKFACMH